MKIDNLRADEQAPHLPLPIQAQDHLEPRTACAECGRPATKIVCEACAAIEARVHELFTRKDP